MRIAVFIIGILGSLAAGTLGGIWLKDTLSQAGKDFEALRPLAAADEDLKARFERWDRLQIAMWLLLAALPVGIVGSILAFRGSGVLGALFMIPAAVAPGIIVPNAFVFTSILLIAGLLSFLVKRPPARQPFDAY